MNKIKRSLSLIIVFVMFGMVFRSYALIPDEIKVYVNGKKVEFRSSPQILNNKTYVPMRQIFESLGYKVKWIPKEKRVIATKGNTNLSIGINNKKASLNGKSIQMADTAKNIAGNTLVPLRSIGEYSNCDVIWVKEQNSVYLENRISNYKTCDQDNDSLVTATDDWLIYSYKSLYKFKFDGSQVKKLRSGGSANLQVVGKDLYGRICLPDLSIRKLDMKTLKTTILTDFEAGSCFIDNGWIYYEKLYDFSGTLYRMKLDGSITQEIFSGYFLDFNVIGDDIYIIGDGIEKLSMITGDSKKIASYSVNDAKVYNNNLYFSAYEHTAENRPITQKGIFRYNPIDGRITQLSTTTADEIKVINNSIYYTIVSDYSTNKASIHRLRIDGSFDMKLCDNVFRGVSVVGNCIYFHSHDLTKTIVCRINTDGTNKTNISNFFN